MQKKKVLYVSQEIKPFLPESNISKIVRELPQGIQENGKEIRVFMPRYGCINERRHQLHEVIRLSGMNLIIDDNDHPLIIKVASIPTARMQVYFIDNDEYFQRKAVLTDKKGKQFEDNDERSIFFCRGVLETVKKLGWAPDIIHCHGWMTSLMPLYVKKYYNDDPHFANAKVIYTAYEEGFEGSLDKDLIKKLEFDGFEESDIKGLKNPDFESLSKIAVKNADAVSIGEESLNAKVEEIIKKSNKSTLEYVGEENCVNAYNEFYDKVLEEDTVLAE